MVERNNRTIKRMAARTQKDPLDMVFWYNFAANTEAKASSSPPQAGVFTYAWRCPDEEKKMKPVEGCVEGKFKEGDRVFVKPDQAKCTTEWRSGIVGGVSRHGGVEIVEVDGIPHHEADIKKVPNAAEPAKEGQTEDDQQVHIVNTRPQRTQWNPTWWSDYAIG